MRQSKLFAIFAVLLVSGCAGGKVFTPMGAWYPYADDKAQLGFRGVDASGQPSRMTLQDALGAGLVCSLPMEVKKHEEECRLK
jgi:hypothetical protein